MTVREEFEAWYRADKIAWMRMEDTAWDAWQAAYAAGRRAGIEEAARLLELEYASDQAGYRRLKQIAQHIRALADA